MKFICEGTIFEAVDYNHAAAKVLDWNGIHIEEYEGAEE